MIEIIVAGLIGIVIGYYVTPAITKLRAAYFAHKQTVVNAAQMKLAADYAAGKAAADAIAAKAAADAATKAIVVAAAENATVVAETATHL